mmetsp:Transcript_33966/g.86848  ORF Transcript_33966/g.86848 Transcript_33966/m.86848 type:complete len:220 (-) Transcript_33966:211-870(-)
MNAHPRPAPSVAKQLLAVAPQRTPPPHGLEGEAVSLASITRHPVHNLNPPLGVVCAGAYLEHRVVRLCGDGKLVVARHDTKQASNATPARRVLRAVSPYEHHEGHGVRRDHLAKQLVEHALRHVELAVARARVDQCGGGDRIRLDAHAGHFGQLAHGVIGLVRLAELLHAQSDLLAHLLHPRTLRLIEACSDWSCPDIGSPGSVELNSPSSPPCSEGRS